eukprot:UN32439
MKLPDSARGLGHAPARGMAGCFAATGRGKQSLGLNLKTKEGMKIFERFVKEVDIVIQNFRPGAAKRMGIDYDTVKKINPNIIYLSSSGFGPTGPYSDNRIYDPVIQSWGGSGFVQKSVPSGKPVLVANCFVDKITALTSAQAMIAALTARENGAGGQHIDMSMLDCCLQFTFPDCFRELGWVG